MPAFNYETVPKAFKTRGNQDKNCGHCETPVKAHVTAYRLEHSWMYIFDTENCAQKFIEFKRLKKEKKIAKARKDSVCYSCSNVVKRGDWYYHNYGDSTWGTRTKKFCSATCSENYG